MRWEPRSADATTATILRRAHNNTHAARVLDAERATLALEWALAHQLDLHDPDVRDLAADPRIGVITLGATSLVIEPCCDAELAVALRIHPLAARSLMADTVDLEARLPWTWAALQAGDVALWVARKIAVATRDLHPAAAAHVDDALAGVIATLPTGRLLDLLAARVTEADTALAETRAAERRTRRGAWLGRPDPDTGLTTLVARGEHHTITQVWTRLDHLAHLMQQHDAAPDTSLEELRGDALTLLANPLAALKLLVGAEHHDHPDAIADAIRDAAPAMTRPRAVAYVHLSPEMLLDNTSTHRPSRVARAEGIGALTKTQLIDLLGHHHVTVKPVIDLADDVSADCYEVPATIAERVHLTRPADTFPYSPGLHRSTDLDHAHPYDDTGPPGQTSVSNLHHLGRTAHRTKTHHPGWHLTLRDGRTIWTTPHGYVLVTDKHGTHVPFHAVPKIDLLWAPGAA